MSGAFPTSSPPGYDSEATPIESHFLDDQIPVVKLEPVSEEEGSMVGSDKGSGSQNPSAGRGDVRDDPEERSEGGYRLLFRGETGENFTKFRNAAEFLLDEEPQSKHAKMLNKWLGYEPLATLANNRPVGGYQTMADRWAELESAYGNAAEAQLAWTELEELKQKGTPIGEFIRTFENLCGLCGIPDRQRAQMFRSKVTAGLKDRLETSRVSTYALMKEQAWISAKAADREYQQSKKMREASKKPQGDKPRWEKTKTTIVAKGARTSEDRGNRPPIKCWNCEEEGHINRDCDKPKKAKARGGRTEPSMSGGRSGKAKGPAPPTGDESDIEEMD